MKVTTVHTGDNIQFNLSMNYDETANVVAGILALADALAGGKAKEHTLAMMQLIIDMPDDKFNVVANEWKPKLEKLMEKSPSQSLLLMLLLILQAKKNNPPLTKHTNEGNRIK